VRRGRSMPRSAIIRYINPNSVSVVLDLISKPGTETEYEEGLAIFVKGWRSIENEGHEGIAYIDGKEEIVEKKRVGGEIERKKKEIPRVFEVNYAYFPQLRLNPNPSPASSGAGNLDHVIVILSDAWTANLFMDAVSKALGVRLPFRRVEFRFTIDTESEIRNQFDDITKIRGDDIVDYVISGLAISGSRLYNSQEYQKVLSGDIRYIGVAIGDNWFMINSSGRITTYRSLTDSDFLDATKTILKKMMAAGAVVT
jgi:hypothetical protein